MYILAKATARHPALGKATVYRTLERMETLGLVRRVHDLHGWHGYGAVEDAARPLLVCTECGRVLPTPLALLTALDDLLRKACGYRIVLDELQIVGVCPECS
jgi:Fe2+ or Zn2+ uptake regulation protein